MKIQISSASTARIGAWLASDKTGLSSRYLAAIALGSVPEELHYPHDPADFKRCIGLLDCLAGSEAMEVLLGASFHSEQWREIYEAFPTLYRLWSQERESERAPLLYAEMKKLGL